MTKTVKKAKRKVQPECPNCKERDNKFAKGLITCRACGHVWDHCKEVVKHCPPRPRGKLAQARALCAKGFSVGYVHDGIIVTLTPENYKWPMGKLVAERLAYDAAYEAKFADCWKCKCAIHDEEQDA